MSTKIWFLEEVSLVLLTANLLILSKPYLLSKPSKGVFRIQSYLQDENFAKIINGFKNFGRKAQFYMFEWGLDMSLPSFREVLWKCSS